MVSDLSSGGVSGYIVPVAGMAMVFGIVAVSRINEYYSRKLQSEERMAAMAKGLPLPEPIVVPSQEITATGARMRMENIRLGGIVTMAGGIASMIALIAISIVMRERDVLAGAAVCIVPIAIGLGLWIDARILARGPGDGPGDSISRR